MRCGAPRAAWQGDADDQGDEVMTITSRSPHDPADIIGEW